MKVPLGSSGKIRKFLLTGDYTQPLYRMAKVIDSLRFHDTVDNASGIALPEGSWFRPQSRLQVLASPQMEATAERKRPDEEHQRLVSEIAAGQADLAAVLDAAGVGVFDIDRTTGMVLDSRGLSVLFGYPATHSLSLADIRARYHPDDGRQVIEQTLFRADDPAVTHFSDEYRLLLPDGSVRWMHARGEFIRDETGRALRTRGLVIDITARKRTEEDRATAQARLVLALQAAQIGVWEWDIVRNTFEYDARARAILGYSAGEPITYEKLRASVHPDDLAKTSPVLQAALNPAVRGHAPFEYRIVRRDGSIRWVHALGDVTFAVTNGSSRPIRYTGTLQDITERKELEEVQTLLIAELHHRNKNTLTLVQALAHQTFRATAERDDLAAFNSRLRALANADSVLTGTQWREAPLSKLLKAALAPFLAAKDRLHTSGDDMVLRASHAFTLALALHELGTNATKYGAWSNDDGAVRIAWHREGNPGPEFHLEWREQGGPPMKGPPSRSGFGSKLVQEALPREFGGRADLDYRPEGVVFTLRAPWPSA